MVLLNVPVFCVFYVKPTLSCTVNETKFTFKTSEKTSINKVDVQNKIWHTLRESIHVPIFPFLFPAPQPPPRAFSASNISKKVFGGQVSAN